MSLINETAIKTPGVYTTEIPTLPPSVAQVSTAVPAFIGYTQKRQDEDGNAIPEDKIKPIKIFSFPEYKQYFGETAENEKNIEVTLTFVKGEFKSAHASFKKDSKPSPFNMFYALRLYFENGGGPCYIVSVGLTSTDQPPSDTDLSKGLEELEAYDEPTLILFPEGQALADEAKYYALISKSIDQCATLQDRFTLVDIHTQFPSTQFPSTNTTINNFRNISPHITGFAKNDSLNYAAAYYPNLCTLFDYQYKDSDVSIIYKGELPSPPDSPPDSPPGSPPGSPPYSPPMPSTLEGLKSKGPLYYTSKEAIRKLSPTLPPTPAIAGIYAKVDGTRGVWKAPANVSINSIYDVTDFITDEEQKDMNIHDTGKSVNAIRPFSGKGILVWGARTLDGNSNEWKFISVRRFFIMVEESAKKATFSFVFEPNDANTWIKVRAMLENYLTLLWRQGALAGAKPEHAFFVRCGLGQTMTAQDILDGKLIIEIGMAAVRPAEFIILRFMHKLQES